jgi:hypothetical protein
MPPEDLREIFEQSRPITALLIDGDVTTRSGTRMTGGTRTSRWATTDRDLRMLVDGPRACGAL